MTDYSLTQINYLPSTTITQVTQRLVVGNEIARKLLTVLFALLSRTQLEVQEIFLLFWNEGIEEFVVTWKDHLDPNLWSEGHCLWFSVQTIAKLQSPQRLWHNIMFSRKSWKEKDSIQEVQSSKKEVRKWENFQQEMYNWLKQQLWEQCDDVSMPRTKLEWVIETLNDLQDEWLA